MKEKKNKIRKIGNSYGILIPKSQLEEWQVQEGQEVYFTLHEDGLLLKKFDPETEEVERLFTRTARKFPNALRKLGQ